MSKFRLQNNVPDVYVNQSRDFQLLLRLYDSIFSGVKFDIDSMQGIINTSKSRNSILPLLSTKVGFFTNLEINDDKLRIILGGFPLIVRKKGSLLAIKQTLNLYLKAEHIKCNIIVSYNSETTTIDGTTILDHTLSIGSDKTLKNPQILQEIFKYILPIGFRLRFYSFRSFSLETTQLEASDDVIILYKVSANPLSQLRRSDIEYTENITDGVHIPSTDHDADLVIAAENEMLGSVGISELVGADDMTNTDSQEEE